MEGKGKLGVDKYKEIKNNLLWELYVYVSFQKQFKHFIFVVFFVLSEYSFYSFGVIN